MFDTSPVAPGCDAVFGSFGPRPGPSLVAQAPSAQAAAAGVEDDGGDDGEALDGREAHEARSLQQACN